MKTSKRLISAGTAIVCALSMCACGSSSSGNASSNNSSAAEKDTSVADETNQDESKTSTDNGMTLITYEPDFYDEILNLDSVKALYKDIDDSVNGLGTILQNELKKQK